MIRNSIRLKTIFGVALIEAVLLLSLILLMIGYIRETNYSALETRAETTARLFATTTKDAVLAFDLASLESFVDEVMKNEGLEYARVLNANGRLMAASAGAEGASPQTDQQMAAVTDGVFDSRAEIREAGQLYGWVEVGFRTDLIEQVIGRAKNWSIGIAALEMLLVALFSFMLGRFLTNKLSALRDAADKIAEGDLSSRIEVRGQDEVDVVARAFNQMSSSLELSYQQSKNLATQLQILNEHLEEKVRLRTQELQNRNSDLAEANDAIRAAQAQLLETEKRATIGVLAAGVAHEINNPLGYVISNVGTLDDYITTYDRLAQALIEAEKAEKPIGKQALEELLEDAEFEFIREDIKELMADTQNGLQRVKAIVEKMSAFRDSSLAEPPASGVSVSKAIALALDGLPEEQLAGIELVNQTEGLPNVCAPFHVLTEIFQSVLENALHACNGRGQIKIGSKFDDNCLCILVEDSGQGVDDQHREKIFDPFFTTKTVGSGSGLGLYRVKMLLDTLGGSISLDSRCKTGACFEICIPVVKV